jgi:hypothetical protein
MQTNYNKARKQKDISTILDAIDSLSLSPNNHGNIASSSRRRVSSSSPTSGTWPIQSPIIIHPSTSSFVKRTPPEVLAHIFSYLDPEGFASANLVCREWHSIAKDDYTWKAGFERFFGVHDIISRLSTTWRGEYIHRSHLIRSIPSTYIV